MNFIFGCVAFILGSVFLGICLTAIPGPAGETPPAADGHGHGGH
jgi:hypothetical protein